MLRNHVLKESTGIGCQHFIVGEAADGHDFFHQGLSHDIGFAVLGFYQHIAVPGMQADSHVAGQSPDGGGPDHEIGLAQIKLAQLTLIILQLELDIDGGAGIVLVLNFCLSQSGLVLGAPVNGLQSFVDIALFKHLAEDLDLLGFEMLVHSPVGMLPVADHTQPFEPCHLPLDVVFRKLLAGVAEFRNGHSLVIQLVLFDDGRLNGHAMVIPAGNIRGVVAQHGMTADDEILQGLVQSVAHVDVAVGEGRAVMQNKPGQILVLLQHGAVKLLLLPLFQHSRLPGRQTSLHGEIGFRGDDGVFVFHGNITSIENSCAPKKPA